jgi:hypothetical protein
MIMEALAEIAVDKATDVVTPSSLPKEARASIASSSGRQRPSGESSCKLPLTKHDARRL